LKSDEEGERLRQVYAARGYDRDPKYSELDPVYLHRIQSMERAALRALAKTGLAARLGELDILDFGCGNGRWFGRWLAWGAMPGRLVGVDAREDVLDLARHRFPTCRFEVVAPGALPIGDASFDVVTQNVVFSSILDPQLRSSSAAEIIRVLRPGGVVVWCDFVYDNPWNTNVKSVPLGQIRKLFPGFDIVCREKVVLAPPLARYLVPLSWLAAEVAELAIPFLRTHLVAVLRKPRAP
jgi:SAM-dependent methyltransferase